MMIGIDRNHAAIRMMKPPLFVFLVPNLLVPKRRLGTLLPETLFRGSGIANSRRRETVFPAVGSQTEFGNQEKHLIAPLPATSSFSGRCRMYSSNSGRNLRSAFFTGQPAPSARPQIVVPGMMPMCRRLRRGCRGPPAGPGPRRMRSMIFSIQPVPSRHGVHWPHASWAKNRQLLCSTSTMLVVLVDDRDRRGAQAQAADLAGAVEVERRVELRLGHEAHADAAGDARPSPCGPSRRRRRTCRSARGR